MLFDHFCVQAAAQVAYLSSEAGEAVLQQLTALLGDLLRILNWNCNLPSSAAAAQGSSAADLPSNMARHQVPFHQTQRK